MADHIEAAKEALAGPWERTGRGQESARRPDPQTAIAHALIAIAEALRLPDREDQS